MVAVRIPGAESIDPVAPARDPGVRADPTDFGAEIGAGAEHMGAALSSLGAHLYQKQKGVEDQVGISTHNIEMGPAAQKAILDNRAAFPDGGPGTTEDLRARMDAAKAQVDQSVAAKGIILSDNATNHVNQKYAGILENALVGGVTYGYNAGITKLKEQNNANVNALSAQVLAGGDVDEALQQSDAAIEGSRALYTDGQLTSVKRAARVTIQRAAIDGAIAAKDVARSRELQRRFFGDGPLPGQSEADQPNGSIYNAIYAQESGGGRNTSTSVTGARGGMQIQPATFAQYARPGENIDNPVDNQAVGRRIIDDLSAKAGGDPARIAVGYFSGPGNISPPGSPTPWKVDKADPTGKTTSSYVADVTRRLGAPENPNTALALEYRNKIDSMDGVNRVEMASAVKDDLASVQQTGQGDPTLSADKISKSLGPNAADDWQTARTRAKTFYDVTQDFATLPVNEMDARIQQLAPKPGQPEFVAQDAMHTAAIAKATAIMEQRKKDPASSVNDDPQVKQAVAAADPKNPATMQAVITARLTAQQRAGISAPAPIPVDETQRLLKPITEAAQLEEAARTPKGQPNRIVLAQQQLVKYLKDQYGPYADAVMTEVIGQATNRRERLDQAAAAGEVMAALINGTTPGAKPVRQVKVAAENNAASRGFFDSTGDFLRGDHSLFSAPSQQPTPKVPSPQSVQILLNAPAGDQARLAGLFNKQFGNGSAEKILAQKVAPTVAPKGTVSVTDDGESYTPE